MDLSRSLGVHALIDNMVSFISGDVGLAPAFKEPEENMSTSPQATILAMEQQQNRAEVNHDAKRDGRWSSHRPPLASPPPHLPPLLQLRLEALHQIVVLISGMEEKGSQPCSAERSSSSFHSSSLLTSVRLQFLAGCFGLGTVGTGGLKRESVQLHHYQVPSTLTSPRSSPLYRTPHGDLWQKHPPLTSKDSSPTLHSTTTDTLQAPRTNRGSSGRLGFFLCCSTDYKHFC